VPSGRRTALLSIGPRSWVWAPLGRRSWCLRLAYGRAGSGVTRNGDAGKRGSGAALRGAASSVPRRDLKIAMVSGLLGAADDPWGVLSWWQTPNARIGDRKPRDLLGTPRARQLRSLAEAVVEPVG